MKAKTVELIYPNGLITRVRGYGIWFDTGTVYIDHMPYEGFESMRILCSKG